MTAKGRDYRRNARIAHLIEDYWAARGHKVNTWIVHCGRKRRQTYWGVRSDLVKPLTCPDNVLKNPASVNRLGGTPND